MEKFKEILAEEMVAHALLTGEGGDVTKEEALEYLNEEVEMTKLTWNAARRWHSHLMQEIIDKEA